MGQSVKNKDGRVSTKMPVDKEDSLPDRKPSHALKAALEAVEKLIGQGKKK